MAQFRYTFTVSGRGEFPWDMLRYDDAFPADAESAAALPRPPGTLKESRRQIRLATHRRGGPTIARWQSFNWSCHVGEETYG